MSFKFTVENNVKIDDEWYKKQKSFSTVEEMSKYLVNNTCSKFTVYINREVVSK